MRKRGPGLGLGPIYDLSESGMAEAKEYIRGIGAKVDHVTPRHSRLV